MRVTTKGRVTIPQPIRRLLGIRGGSEVDFLEEDGRVYVVRRHPAEEVRESVERYVGAADSGLSTDEILALTRRDAE